MSKKNKNNVNVTNETNSKSKDTSETVKKEQKEDKKLKNNKNVKKDKGKFRRKTRETVSELKKVTWPTFTEVCKRTGVVLVVVLVFAVIIFGMDYGLGALMRLLTNR